MRKAPILFALAAAAALFCAACELVPLDGNEYFDYDMRGVWKTDSSTAAGFRGTLTIEYDTVKIEGFTGTGVYPATNKPFDNFTRDIDLEAYPERNNPDDDNDDAYRGALYVKTRGDWQPGVPFYYYRDGANYTYVYCIELTFGTQTVKLIKQ